MELYLQQNKEKEITKKNLDNNLFIYKIDNVIE